MYKRSLGRKLPPTKENNDQTQSSPALPDWCLLADYQKLEDLLGENGILKPQLIKAFVERALQAELAAHLGHDKREAVANDTGNTRIVARVECNNRRALHRISEVA